MRRSHLRFPPEKWTSLSSVSGPTGTRRRRSSSCSSASSSRTREAGARCPGPLHRPWGLHLPSRFLRPLGYHHPQCLRGQTLQCPHLPRVPSPFFSTIFRRFFRQTKHFKSKYWKPQKLVLKIEATSLIILTQQVQN